MTEDGFRQVGSSRRGAARVSCQQSDRRFISWRRAMWCGRARTTIALFLVAIGIGIVASPTSGALTLPIGTNRVALVMGNNGYDRFSLRNARNDAEDFGTALERYGFMVTLLLDADRAGVMDALQRFGGRGMVQADVAVVFFSGHGFETNGVTYLVPGDARTDTREAALRESIAIDHLFEVVRDARGPGIVVIDASRVDPFPRQRALSAGPKAAPIPDDLLVAYSASPGGPALDSTGDERNSPYVAALLTQLTASSPVTIRDVFQNATRDVFVGTERAQRPVVRQTLGSIYYTLARP